MRPIFCILILFLSWKTLPLQASSEAFIYEKDVDGTKTLVKWTLQDKGHEIQIKGKSSASNIHLLLKPEMNTKSFTCESINKKKRYTIYRKNQSLIVNQDNDGHGEEKTLSIGNNLWIQEFNFSLKPFILSDKDALNFYIVRPGNFDTHYMEASKKEREKLDVKGKVYDALKVEITLTGLKKLFWKAQLWYNAQNGELLKYLANEGPNTPVTTLLLIPTPKEHNAVEDFLDNL